MIRRTGDSDNLPKEDESAASNINLIEEFLSKTAHSSLRNSKEEKERQNEVISYGGSTTAPVDLLISHNIEGENVDNCDTEGESNSTTSDLIRNTSDSGFSTNHDYCHSSDTPKRSCFIDASTLYDENEFNSLPTVTTASPFRSGSSSSSSQARSSSDNEKRQGYLVFKNSIHQYSGHPIPVTTNTTVTTNSSSKDAEDFEILDFPEENGTPQNSLAYIPTAAHDDDRGRVEEAAPIMTVDELFSARSTSKRYQKHDESAPIVSGGAAINDFKPNVTDSPSVKRRTEMCPIVSGGFCDTDIPLETKEPKKRSASVTSASWVVDVSSLKSANSDTKNEYCSLKYTRESNSPKPSLSFYVNFEPEKEKPNLRDFENPKSLQLTKSTGFFIDLSEDKTEKRKKEVESVPDTVIAAKKEVEGDTKNIFSMFIDFGDKNKKTRSGTPRLSSSFSNKSLEGSYKGGFSQKDNKETSATTTEVKPKMSSSDEKSGIVHELLKKQSIAEVTTPSPDKHSIASDSFTSNTTTSHDGIVAEKKPKINETFDKSSIGSLTDGILSKDLSPISSTETDDNTFQRDSDGSFVPKKSDTEQNSNQSIIKSQESDMQNAMDTLQARIEIQQQQLLDTPTNDANGSTFVKLSDMDKQPKSMSGVEKKGGKGMSTSAGVTGVRKHNWLAELNQDVESLGKQTNLSPSEGNVNSIPLASSVENSKSLSRLFPHLSDGK